MKMYLGETPVKSLNIKHYELDTNSATMVASDLQAGVTAFAKGKKVTGTGKSFEFAYYGQVETNLPLYVPNNINVVEVASTIYPIKLIIALNNMENVDFTIEQIVGTVTIDGVEYNISVQALNNILTISCEKSISLQVFYGKDNYV